VYLFLLGVFLLSGLVSAESYYADSTLTVDEKGTVVIEGTSNYEYLYPQSTNSLTSKKGEFWLLNITTNKIMSDYILSVYLPARAEVNYMKVSGNLRLVESGRINLITHGEDETAFVLVQYKLGDSTSSGDIIFGAVVLLVIIAIILFMIFFKKYVKSKKYGKNKNIIFSEPEISEKKKVSASTNSAQSAQSLAIVRRTLTDNQNKIIDVLIQAREPITQKQLMHRAGLAKATLSRNIDLLVKKNILEKQSRGLTNVIFLKDDFLNK
jgi:uncharacterized membrane protein